MEVSDKGKYYLKLVLVTAIAYFSFKYLLPLFFPFLLAYLLTHFIRPMVKYVNERFRINRRVAIIILLTIVVSIIGIGLAIIVIKTTGQIKNLVTNYDKYERKMDIVMDKTCCMAEKYSGIDKDKIEGVINKGIDGITDMGKSHDVRYAIMNKSLSTVVMFGEWFVIVLTAIVTSYFMLMNEGKKANRKRNFLKTRNHKNEYNESQNNESRNVESQNADSNNTNKKSDESNTESNRLITDLKRISGSVGKVCIAYIKTQLVIMLITSVICFIGFMIMKNNYALFLAILVGVLDALPIIGVGILLIPFVIIYIILGNYFKAGVTFVVFVICYLVREFAEPKLMGDQIGISPIMSLISMYVGYKLFGIVGIVTGPIAYVLIDTLMKQEN